MPHTLARRLSETGWLAVRPSFRGVDGTAGEYSDGVGEAEDMLAVVQHLRSQFAGLPLALVGFSFGAHVFARTACALEQDQPLDALVLMGLPVGVVAGGRNYDAMSVPERTLLMHGEADDIAPLTNVLSWARLEQRPVLVFPGANHFFKGCLDKVANKVREHLDLALTQ